jgi:hypothetical protein
MHFFLSSVVEGAQRANAVALEVAGEVVARGPKREARGSILQHFEPGRTRAASLARAQARPGSDPSTNLTGRAWAEILEPAKFFFWARAQPEMLF